MAEENAFLDYNDGFVLHNGLPVKWVTAASAYEKWMDFDIIIERNLNDGGYAGFTIPYIYQSGSDNKDISPAIMYDASAYWGSTIGVHDGTLMMKTNKTKTCDIVNKTGTEQSITSTNPRIPCEYVGTTAMTANVYGYIYPTSSDNHYYFGVKYAADYGVPNRPDLTNHGLGTSVIHKLYAPNCSSLELSFNASDYSAIKNAYLPNIDNVTTWKVQYPSLGLNGRDDTYSTTGKLKLLENWYAPKMKCTSGSWLPSAAGNFNNIEMKDSVFYAITATGVSAENTRFLAPWSKTSTSESNFNVLNNSVLTNVSADRIYCSGSTLNNVSANGIGLTAFGGGARNCNIVDTTATSAYVGSGSTVNGGKYTSLNTSSTNLAGNIQAQNFTAYKDTGNGIVSDVRVFSLDRIDANTTLNLSSNGAKLMYVSGIGYRSSLISVSSSRINISGIVDAGHLSANALPQNSYYYFRIMNRGTIDLSNATFTNMPNPAYFIASGVHYILPNSFTADNNVTVTTAAGGSVTYV